MPRKKDPQEKRLIQLFGSTSRARILQLFLSPKDRNYYQRQIMYDTGLTLNPVQRELANLTSLGILKKEKTRSRVYYSLNHASQLLDNLTGIIEKIS